MLVRERGRSPRFLTVAARKIQYQPWHFSFVALEYPPCHATRFTPWGTTMSSHIGRIFLFCLLFSAPARLLAQNADLIISDQGKTEAVVIVSPSAGKWEKQGA